MNPEAILKAGRALSKLLTCESGSAGLFPVALVRVRALFENALQECLEKWFAKLILCGVGLCESV